MLLRIFGLRFARVSLIVLSAVVLCYSLHVCTAQDADPFGGGEIETNDDPFGGPNPPSIAPVTAVERPRRVANEPTPMRETLFIDAEAIDAALEREISVDFIEVPLKDVVAYIEGLTGARIDFDRKALEDVGLDVSEPVTIQLQKTKARDVLALMLEQLGLTSHIRHGSLEITTPEEVENHLLMRTYDVSSLVAPRNALAADDYDGYTLPDLITSIIAPVTWDEVGGLGSVRMHGTTLVINQSREIHEELAKFLATLVKARDAAHASLRGPVATTSFSLDGQTPAEEVKSKIAQALRAEIAAEFIETPLQDVANFLRDKTGVEFFIDDKSLEEVGIGRDTPVTVSATLPLSVLLDVMLRGLDLDWVVRGDVLLITSEETCCECMVTRTYPVLDLVGPSEAASHLLSDFNDPIERAKSQADFDTLIEAITSLILPTTWEEVGGPGGIQDFDGCLVISQHPDAHREIAALLETYRKLKALEVKDPAAAVAAGSMAILESQHAETRAKLTKKVGMVNFVETPLQDVIAYLNEATGAQILLDYKAIEDVGIGTDTPVNTRLHDDTLEVALQRILTPLSLQVCPKEYLQITTPEEIENALDIRLYYVGDLTISSAGTTFGQGSLDNLIDVITTSATQQTWDEVGGPGSIRDLLEGRVIAVSQTDEVHQQVENILASLRRELAKNPKAKADWLAALKLNKPDSAVAAEGKLHTKAYKLTIGDPEVAEQLATLIKQIIAPESWEAQPRPLMRASDGLLMVRHTPAVHRQIDELLLALEAGGGLPVNDLFGDLRGIGSGQSQGALSTTFTEAQLTKFVGAPALPHDLSKPAFDEIKGLTLPGDKSLPDPEADAKVAFVFRLRTNASPNEAELASLILDSIDEESWSAGDGVFLRPVAGRLVIRQRLETQRKVLKLLEELDVLAPYTPPYRGGGYGCCGNSCGLGSSGLSGGGFSAGVF